MSNAQVLSGLRYGKLTVLSSERNANGYPGWRCLCDCGMETVVRTARLNSGGTQSCGCLRRKHEHPAVPGTMFGDWTVLSGSQRHWLCRCRCGTERRVMHKTLRNGSSTSCGCSYIHGQSSYDGEATGAYKSWTAMVSRCTDPASIGYANYGGAGITVCERWLRFANFYADMGDRPAGKTLDRRDNAKGYEPGNVRWATPREQANNRRSNRRVFFRGGSYTISEVARMTGVSKVTLAWRVRNGKPLLRDGEHPSAAN